MCLLAAIAIPFGPAPRISKPVGVDSGAGFIDGAVID